MEKTVEMGTNRTGMDMSPLQGKVMEAGAAEATPTAGSEAELHELGKDYIRAAGTLGSVPLPGTVRGALKAMKDKLTGRHTEVLLNKLGERLAFERSGVRVYEAFIAKCEAAAAGDTLPAAVDLDMARQFCIEEAQHFALLRDVIEGLGADATAQTPDADVAALASMGQMKVIQDPRTSVPQCLEALLGLEQADNAAWELLVRLSRELALDEIADRFHDAEEQEDRHLATVRAWLEAAVLEEAGLGASAASAPRH